MAAASHSPRSTAAAGQGHPTGAWSSRTTPTQARGPSRRPRLRLHESGDHGSPLQVDHVGTDRRRVPGPRPCFLPRRCARPEPRPPPLGSRPRRASARFRSTAPDPRPRTHRRTTKRRSPPSDHRVPSDDGTPDHGRSAGPDRAGMAEPAVAQAKFAPSAHGAPSHTADMFGARATLSTAKDRSCTDCPW